ncbi:TolC family protein [Fluviicola sp.]|jgi:outer membrane protein TolC|uniref:TolC family protein n=1 Tax=Fluviicola sp. TaxID=1917219 RepID=UPI0028243648|nr:TolC family protein [Fluviicola sp.]MDR0803005.1 TolC family protein [Fluviicola sp.]
MRKVFLGVLLVLGVGSSASAQVLDLETCLRMADTANLSIVNSRLDVAANKSQILSYLAARLPKVTFTGDYRYNAIIPGQLIPAEIFGGTPGTYSKVAFGVPFNLASTIQLQQTLYNPQVNYGINTLKIQQQLIEIQQKVTERDSKSEVANVFFNLQAVNKQVAFIDSNLINIEKLIGNMEAMEKQQMVIKTEVDKLRINRLNSVNQKQTLQANKDQLEMMLKILIGIPEEQTVTLASDDLVEKSILVDGATINYPELELISAQIKMNEEEKKGNNMAYLPTLSFVAAYSYTYNTKPSENVRTGIESAFLGLSLNWTLFDGLEKHYKQKVTNINHMKLENQEELTRQQLHMQTENAKKQIEIQVNSLGIAQEQLKLAQSVYKQTELQYNEGTVDSNDLVNSSNSLQQAQTNVVLAYVNLRQAELEYLKNIGGIK